MLYAGWAVVYMNTDPAYLRGEAYAKEHQLGMWQGKFTRPEEFRKEQNLTF